MDKIGDWFSKKWVNQMFQNVFQSGPAVQIISAVDKNPQWKINKQKWKLYDKGVKGYIIVIDSPSTKLAFPNNERQSLGLIQRYLVLQCFIHPAQAFALQIALFDTTNTKRRLLFTHSAKEQVNTPLLARIPNSHFTKGSWINLSIDLVAFMNSCFPGNTFRSIDSLTIHAFCKLRRVFTMRNPILDPETPLAGAEQPPRQLEFPPGVDFQNQLVSPLDTPKPLSPRPPKQVQPQTKIAFGRKIPVGTAPGRIEGKVSPRRKPVQFNTAVAFHQKALPQNRQSIHSEAPARISSAASNRYSTNIQEQKVLEESVPEEIEIYSSENFESIDQNIQYQNFNASFSSENENPMEIEQRIQTPKESREWKKSVEKKCEIIESYNPMMDSFENPLDKENSMTKGVDVSGGLMYSIQQSLEGYNPNFYMQDSIEHDFYPSVPETKQSVPRFYEQAMNQNTQPRPFTPPFSDPQSMQNIQSVQMSTDSLQAQEEVELQFDPVLKCYYDPATFEYYEIN